jgi:hypothetical protein
MPLMNLTMAIAHVKRVAYAAAESTGAGRRSAETRVWSRCMKAGQDGEDV